MVENRMKDDETSKQFTVKILYEVVINKCEIKNDEIVNYLKKVETEMKEDNFKEKQVQLIDSLSIADKKCTDGDRLHHFFQNFKNELMV